MVVTDEELVLRLRMLLAQSDLQSTTERMLRKQLEGHFNEDLSAKKAVIREEVERYLAQQEAAPAEAKAEPHSATAAAQDDDEQDQAEADEEDDLDEADERPKKRKRKSSHGFGSRLSAEMQEFIGAPRMQRTQVVKAIWDYIKAHNLQNPSNKRKIMLDDKLATIFKPPLDMFSMNKQLSRHVFTEDTRGGHEDGEEDDDAEDDSEGEQVKKPKRSSGAGKAKASKDGSKTSSNNAFTKQLNCSPELSALLGGQTTISRPELTRWFWAYIKERGLQDPDNKKVCLCGSDAALFNVTRTERFDAFGFMKHFKDHLS